MTSKKQLRRTIDVLTDRLGQCEQQQMALQKGIRKFLEAEHAGEMGNRDKAIEHLEALMGVMRW